MCAPCTVLHRYRDACLVVANALAYITSLARDIGLPAYRLRAASNECVLY